MSSINLSPKHGVNPFIPGCFWCGNNKNMILLPGKLKGDAPAPPNGTIVDVIPCDDCEKKFSKVINDGNMLIFEIDEPHKVGKIVNLEYAKCNNRYVTGRMVAVSMEAFQRIFPYVEGTGDEIDAHNETLRVAMEKHVMLTDYETFETIFGEELKRINPKGGLQEMQRSLLDVLNDELSADKMGDFTPDELANYLIENNIITSKEDMNRLVIEGIQKAVADDDEFPIHYYPKDEPMREEGKAVELGDQLTDEYIENNLNQ